MTRLARVGALAATLVATACGDGTGPTPLGPTEEVSVEFCNDLLPSWVAYQNAGQQWVKVTPNASGVVTFDATEKISFAYTLEFFGSSLTQISNTTRAELSSVGLPCPETGTGAVSGSMAGYSGEQTIRLTIGTEQASMAVQAPDFSFTAVPNRPLDFVATRYATASTSAPDRIAIIRGVDPSTMPQLTVDLTGAESQPVASNVLTIGGGVGNDIVDVQSHLLTANGTQHEIAAFTAFGTNSFALPALPASLGVPSDMHSVNIVATNAAGDRQLLRFYHEVGSVSASLGPALTTPTVSTIATSPHVRLRAMLPSQTEYPSAATFEVFQSTGSFSARILGVITSQGYLGGTPASWDISIPDMSSAAFKPIWGLAHGEYQWQVSAFNGSLELFAGGGTITDGLTLTSATRTLNTSAGISRDLASTMAAMPLPPVFRRARR